MVGLKTIQSKRHCSSPASHQLCLKTDTERINKTISEWVLSKMQPFYTQKHLHIQKFRSTSTGEEQEQTQGWLKGLRYPVFALRNAAGVLWVGGCTSAVPVLPCTRYPPPTGIHKYIYTPSVLYETLTAAVFRSRPTRKGSGKSSDRVWDTPICSSASAIGKELL